VGYGKGGVLTEAVRQNPYSLVLLDEVEKAHPDVMELFYQVFDKGTLEDSEGLTVDFKNTLILLTSNAGSDTILKTWRDAEGEPDADALSEKVRQDLLGYFKPAFLGRLVIVPYYPLSDPVIRNIIRLKLALIQERFLQNHKATLTYSNELVAAIAARCTEVDTGARNVDHILTQMLLPELSGELLKRMAVGEGCTGIYAYLNAASEFSYRFDPPISASDATFPSSGTERPLDWSPPKHFPAQPPPKPPDRVTDYKHVASGKSRIRINRRTAAKKSKRWLDLFKKPSS
jgi:type VI secretion system protein VasG